MSAPGGHFDAEARPVPFVPFETPRAPRTDETPGIAERFRAAAQRTREARFNGVGSHSARGHLLDRLLRDGTDTYADRCGGPVENRVRLAPGVVDAEAGVVGADRMGVRLPPWGGSNGMTGR